MLIGSNATERRCKEVLNGWFRGAAWLSSSLSSSSRWGLCVHVHVCCMNDLITWYPLRSSALVIARPIPFQGPYTLAGRWPSSLSLPPLLPQ